MVGDPYPDPSTRSPRDVSRCGILRLESKRLRDALLGMPLELFRRTFRDALLLLGLVWSTSTGFLLRPRPLPFFDLSGVSNPSISPFSAYGFFIVKTPVPYDTLSCTTPNQSLQK